MTREETKMRWNANKLLLLLSISLVSSIGDGKTVDLFTKTINNFGDDEIVRALSRNKTDSSDNFTFFEVISDLRNHSAMRNHRHDGIWEIQDFPDNYHTNPYYDDFAEKIDIEAKRFFQIVPTYDPAAGSISEGCKRHTEIYRKELKKFTLWALKMFDATAKIPSGLLNGNVNQLGDFDECIGVEGSEGVRGKYCLAYLQLDIDRSRPDLEYLHRLLHSHYAFRSNTSDPGHRVPRFSTVHWAVCSPAACSSKDVESSLKETIAKHTVRTGLKITVQVDKEMCQVQRTNPLPTVTIIVGFFFTAIIILSIVAAFYDHYDVDASEILLSFSLKRNYQKLVSLKRDDGDIATLHGVRALNAVMLIVAHKSMALFFNPYVNRTEMTEYLGKPWTVIGRAASLYTDPFIMLSGLLTAYSFVGRLNRTGNLDIKREYFSRLMRLVPTLGALILFCTYIMPFIGSGPQWNLVVTHHADICKKTWWRNFLFIHNYFGFENMCLTHTHHLGIDTQLFALSPLMVMMMYKWRKFGTFALFFMALASTGLRYYVTYEKNLNNYVFFGTSIRQLFDTANMSYILPTHRLTVYIIGIFMGYLLRIYPRDYKLSRTVLNIGWIVFSLMALGAFFGPAGMGSINYKYNPIHAATYNAFAPIAWCSIFAWTIFVSHTGGDQGWFSNILAWKGFLVTTRLSYAIYLTQFPVFFYNVGQTRSAEHYEFFRMTLNFKELTWIVTMSAILTLLFDTPFQNIKNYLLKKSSAETTIKSMKTE